MNTYTHETLNPAHDSCCAHKLKSLSLFYVVTGGHLQIVFSPPRFSFHSLVTDFSSFTNECLLPRMYLVAQGTSFSVLPEPFHSLLLLPGQQRQQLGQSDIAVAVLNCSATSQLSHGLRFSVAAQSCTYSWVTREALPCACFVLWN